VGVIALFQVVIVPQQVENRKYGVA